MESLKERFLRYVAIDTQSVEDSSEQPSSKKQLDLLNLLKRELESMGVDVDGGFYMGVFRADYRKDLSVNWYSAVSSDDEYPDFHKPDMLFATKLFDK